MFPDAKWLIIKYLAEQLEAPVMSRVPSPRPSQFVRVRLAGGQGLLNQAFEEVALTVESWDNDEHQAAITAQVARAALRRIHQVDGNPVYRYREYGPPIDLPDESGQWRYTFTFTVRLRTLTA